VDGVVLRRLLESERIVPTGEPLIEVADPSRLEIVADYLSMDAMRIRPGQQVYIEHWGGDGPLHGRVRRVEPYGFTKVSALGVEEQRVNVVIDFDDPREAWAALGDGYRVEVPTSSLFRSGESWGVFAVRDGEAGLREIEIGARGNLEAEVVSGLDAGVRVVVHPGDAISDGVRVTPR
jgi:HlyD family secretion protein